MTRVGSQRHSKKGRKEIRWYGMDWIELAVVNSILIFSAKRSEFLNKLMNC
jgi:hypothetical protein